MKVTVLGRYKAKALAVYVKDFKQARKQFLDVAKQLHDVNSFVAFAALLQVLRIASLCFACA
jgi:hypothetical protein